MAEARSPIAPRPPTIRSGPPTAADDFAHGFAVGDTLIDTAAAQGYTCVDNTTAAAVWGGVHVGTVDPTVNDDLTKGYGVGFHWLNTATSTTFTCFGNATGAAVWKAVSRLVSSIVDYDMAALVTVGDEDPAVATGISHTPGDGSLMQVQVNGHLVAVGDGTKVADCYFSSDGGTNVRNIASIASGDTCHWVGSHAGYQLSIVDVVSFIYGV